MNTFANYFLKLSAVSLFLAATAPASFLPVCQRTQGVKAFIEQSVKKTCDAVTENDLLSIKRIAVGRNTIQYFQVDDFTGLTNLEILNIRSNPYTELPEGLLKPLVHLKTLVIIDTKLRHYPNDFLAYAPDIQNIHVFRNPVRTISESYFTTLEKANALKVLDVDNELQPAELQRLQRLFPAGGRVELILN